MGGASNTKQLLHAMGDIFGFNLGEVLRKLHAITIVTSNVFWGNVVYGLLWSIRKGALVVSILQRIRPEHQERGPDHVHDVFLTYKMQYDAHRVSPNQPINARSFPLSVYVRRDVVSQVPRHL